MYLQKFGVSHAISYYRSKMMWSHKRCCWGAQHTHSKKHLKRIQKTTRTSNTGTTRHRWNDWVVQPNGTVCLCLDLVRLNQTLIRPIHRDPTLNDILPKWANVHYMTINDASSGYCNLDLNKKSLYLSTFTFQFCRHQFTRLSFGLSPAGDLFHQKKSMKYSKIYQRSLA